MTPRSDGGPEEGRPAEDEHWFVVKGRRWRRTDPSLPKDLVAALQAHLGRGRSGVGVAKRAGDEEAVAAARRRVGLAKHGLGERGPTWWEEPEAARLERAEAALEELDALDE
ncbi:biopolymer transporter Tol [Plantibacter sp. ME-Dv--P-095]|uniref:biopolymer transporter Tol n=1 Tax=Plantibacter sp. ME-Dv--P-095 TaxID=3040299 RepID=UPI00254B5143|nr:biopolymer transporter Tol [Plantibacter sp. ME-Dv--P-095]